MYTPTASTSSMDVIFEQYWSYADVTSASAAATGDGTEYFTTPAVRSISDSSNIASNCNGADYKCSICCMLCYNYW